MYFLMFEYVILVCDERDFYICSSIIKKAIHYWGGYMIMQKNEYIYISHLDKF